MSDNEISKFISNQENDYNPFQIPKIIMDHPFNFNYEIAIKGSPPFHKYKKSDFAKLSIQSKAAYADGVVRGSFTKSWMKSNYNSWDPYDSSIRLNIASIGGLAYIALKLNDQKLCGNIQIWSELNFDNTKYL